jgi:DNA topoisomerase II
MVKEKTNNKTIEETYQKLSQREHVLRRSGVYIGDIKKNTEELWVLGDNKMVKQFVEYSPGFMKIFDEVLSNATDHAIRDSTVNKIEVTYSKDTGEISIYNNGSGVPVVLHKEQNMYVPELIFGHLLSGSNYNDNDTRTTVGVNGMGIKLTNIFSKKFVVETVDSENKKKFIQEFSNNMADKTKPKITSASNTKSYTKITFIPDYTRFSMENLDDDTILLIKKRVYDCIANTKSHVNLYLNGEKIKGKSFTDYIKYYFDDNKIISEQNIQTIKGTEFIWEYAIVPSEHYEQVSFVNGNCTHLGGKHVDYILYQIINKIKDLLETKKKLVDVKPNFIKDKFCLFLKATIINPSFNSQTKETLTTQVKDFGCKVEVTESFINKIYKSSITDEIVAFL